MKIAGRDIFLKLLSPEDVTPAYVEWMQDDDIIHVLESRWMVYTLDTLKAYVQTVNQSSHSFLLGIFAQATGMHIGNIKIGEINQIHRFGEIGLLIGDKQSWGRGYGTEAIRLATEYAFTELNLHKIVAGIYANNIGSYKAFLKAGYKEVGRLEKHRWYQGQYVDQILVEKFREVG